jgi:hypothetical protein
MAMPFWRWVFHMTQRLFQSREIAVAFLGYFSMWHAGLSMVYSAALAQRQTISLAPGAQPRQ